MKHKSFYVDLHLRSTLQNFTLLTREAREFFEIGFCPATNFFVRPQKYGWTKFVQPRNSEEKKTLKKAITHRSHNTS